MAKWCNIFPSICQNIQSNKTVAICIFTAVSQLCATLGIMGIPPKENQSLLTVEKLRPLKKNYAVKFEPWLQKKDALPLVIG